MRKYNIENLARLFKIYESDVQEYHKARAEQKSALANLAMQDNISNSEANERLSAAKNCLRRTQNKLTRVCNSFSLTLNASEEISHLMERAATQGVNNPEKGDDIAYLVVKFLSDPRVEPRNQRVNVDEVSVEFLILQIPELRDMACLRPERVSRGVRDVMDHHPDYEPCDSRFHQKKGKSVSHVWRRKVD